MKSKIFVIALILLNVGAAIQSACIHEFRNVIYYTAAAILNAAVGL